MALPTGSSISPASCGTIGPNEACTLTITPGTTPSTPGTPAPTPITPSVLNVTYNDNGKMLHLSSQFIILTYSNFYQQGYVYGINDSVPADESVGITVAGSRDATLDFFPNPTAEENCFVDTVLESSCTGVYTPVLRAKSPRTSLSAASLERSLML